MADDESIIDKAIGLIPGVGTSKRTTKPTVKAQLALLQRNLAKLTRDVEKLGKLIVKTQEKKPARPRTAKRARAGRKTKATARA